MSGNALYELLIGGLMLGAFFMATDYTTSPITRKGQVIYAVGCGVMTSVIRIYGGYPEGVSYSILFMSLFVPLIDKYTKPRAFGGAK
jgi:electron transport complex protein RnfD